MLVDEPALLHFDGKVFSSVVIYTTVTWKFLVTEICSLTVYKEYSVNVCKDLN